MSNDASASGEEPDDLDREPMAPPREPCECWCLHCGRTFMSTQIWFQKVIGDPSGFPGYWMCPTPNCSGMGFTFDIFPTDPDHPANDGWVTCDEEDEEFDEDAELSSDADQPWDPTEAKYQDVDGEEMEEDLEGEEWKYGLQPGERPMSGSSPDLTPEDLQSPDYDGPDLRPREIHWKEGGESNAVDPQD